MNINFPIKNTVTAFALAVSASAIPTGASAERGGPGCGSGEQVCSETGGTVNTNTNTNTLDVGVSNRNNVTSTNNVISEGGEGGSANSNAISGPATANNGGVSVNNTYDHRQAAATAYSPALNIQTNGCNDNPGLSIGVSTFEMGASFGAGLSAGVIPECMTFQRAETIMNTGAYIYEHNETDGADMIAIGVGAMGISDPEVIGVSISNIANANCTGSGIMNRFRGCNKGASTPKKAP